MRRKAFDIVETKADDQTGSFEALVAVFGNIDRGGDRILPGAFNNTLEQWRLSGDPIPVILSHQWANPHAHIGVANPWEVRERSNALHVRGRLDIDDNDVARQTYKLLKRRSLREFSFAYTVPEGGQRRAKDGANELVEVDLIEVGPTLKGMNPSTELHAVKSALAVSPGRMEDDEVRRQVDHDVEELVKRYELRDLRRECDRIRLEAALGWNPAPKPQPEQQPKSVPSMAELRQDAARLGIALPPPRRVAATPAGLEALRATARDEMLVLMASVVRARAWDTAPPRRHPAPDEDDRP